ARPEEVEGRRGGTRETPGTSWLRAAERTHSTRRLVKPEATCAPARAGRNRQPKDPLPACGPGQRDRRRRSAAATGAPAASASCPTPATVPPPRRRAATGGDTHKGPT